MDRAIAEILPQTIGVANVFAHPVTVGWAFHLLVARIVVVLVATLEVLVLNALTSTPTMARVKRRELG